MKMKRLDYPLDYQKWAFLMGGHAKIKVSSCLQSDACRNMSWEPVEHVLGSKNEAKINWNGHRKKDVTATRLNRASETGFLQWKPSWGSRFTPIWALQPSPRLYIYLGALIRGLFYFNLILILILIQCHDKPDPHHHQFISKDWMWQTTPSSSPVQCEE